MLEVLEAIRSESSDLVSDPGSVCVSLQPASFRLLISKESELNS